MELHLLRLPTHVTPNTAVLVASLGIGLIFLEFNRPGRILPGATGLLLALLAFSRLLQTGMQPWAVLLLAGCIAVYLANLWQTMPFWLLCLATFACIVGLRFLVPANAANPVSLWVAICCGGTLGSTSAALTRVAHRARRSKALD
ncbi:MAG: hypothetical protein ACRYFU_02010 [Janthinobacterium lividum]